MQCFFNAGDGEDEEGEMDFFSANMTDLVPDEEALTGIKGELENQEQISSTIGEAAKGRREALNALKAQVSAWKHHEYVIVSFLLQLNCRTRTLV